MNLTVRSLSDKQLALLKKTNETESSLTAQYHDVLVSIIERQGVSELIGREWKDGPSLNGNAVQVVFKGKVKMGYPDTPEALARVRGLCSPTFKFFIKPTIEVVEDEKGDEVYQYDHDKLVEFRAGIKSGKLSICKARKAQGGGGGGSASSKVQAFIDWFDAMDDAGKAKFKKSPDAKKIVKRLT